MRTKHTFRLPPELARQLADYAGRKRLHQAFVVETALTSFLSPDNSERMEAALGKRLDRLTRQVERLERHVTISNEALALFVRFWLTATSPVPDAALPAAQPKAENATSGLSRPWEKGSPRARVSQKRYRWTPSRKANNRAREASSAIALANTPFCHARLRPAPLAVRKQSLLGFFRKNADQLGISLSDRRLLISWRRT